jgi:hypothetical protein
VQTRTIDLFTGAGRPIALEAAMRMVAPRPVLLIAAGSWESEYAEQYRSAAPDSTEVWTMNDTPHMAGLAGHPQEYRRRVFRFFEGALVAP